MKFFDLKAQHKEIKEDLDRRLAEVLYHQNFILGPEIDELEDRLKKYVGVDHCVSVGNGTDALQIALMAIGIKPGDEVITPCFSYISVAEVVTLLGAKPVYIDVSDETYNIDVNQLESKITSKTRCIVPVNLFGQCADFNEIMSLGDRFNIPVIEDGAQSFGALYNGRKSGSLATLSCTSFFPTKPLGCYGDGGAVFTNDPQLAKKVRQISRHGQASKYDHILQGVNSRLDSIQGAVLLAKLKIFDNEVQKRRRIGDRYGELFLKSEFKNVPIVSPGRTHVWAQYSIRVQNRDLFCSRLNKEGIPTAVHYPTPLNKQPAVANDDQIFPVAAKIANEIVSLPMGPYLDPTDQEKIVKAVTNLSLSLS